MKTALTHTLPLAGKRAVIFGAGGSVGSAVAGEFAAQGATVFLSGRVLDNVEQVAQEISQNGGTAYAAQVDALDEAAVQAYLEGVVHAAGSIDILINLMGPQARDYGNGMPTMSLPLEQFMLPLTTLVQSQFITARAAAQHMIAQHSGVIIFVTAIVGRGFNNTSAIGSAFGAMEALLRCLAKDLGPEGIRVVGIRSSAMIDTRTIQQSMDNRAGQADHPSSKEEIAASYAARTLLGISPTAVDTARAAAFLASDSAHVLTGTILNSSSGSILD